MDSGWREAIEIHIKDVHDFVDHSNESGDPVGGCAKCLALLVVS